MRLTRWNKETPPSLEALRGALTGEGLTVSEWSDPAGTVYPVHTHEYPEVRVILRGQLRVGLPETGEEFLLNAGDRLDLPANTPHWADVSGHGAVVYLSASKNNHTNHTNHNGHKK
ncbi:MAG: cupin domain-containing protein [Chloroflexi bacterium]|nr:cupin domain-containing protein [Chloroflexota bacterium]